MNSLLKEIDDGMEIATTPQWKLGPEDRSLEQDNDNKVNNRRIAGSETTPRRNSVELHAGADESSHNTDTDIRWNRLPPKGPAQVAVPSALSREESQEGEEEEKKSEEEPDLTMDELRKHGLQDTGAKLSNVLDSRQNIDHLKRMVQDVDARAIQEGQESNDDSENQFGDEGDDEGDDEDEDEDEDLSPANDYSPSRIPLTNTVNINNFSLENAADYSRVSSGSSFSGSGSDLQTTTINDRCKLLEYNSQTPITLKYGSPENKNFVSTLPKFTKLPNPSNALRFTAEYEPAKENVHGSTSDVNSENREASVENLDISSGMRGISPEIPQHNDTTRQEDHNSSNTTTSNDSDRDQEASRGEIEYTALHDVSSSYPSGAGEISRVPSQAECSKLTEDLNASMAPMENSRVLRRGSQTSENSNTREKGPQLPPLIPVVEASPIFNEDPFEEIFDSSGESLDLRKSMKPSDYISIWHSQANNLRSYSSTISANSQFSQRSVSSQSSTHSAPHNEFRFKPRIVSRSRYYNPENRIVIPSDSEEEDDDLIYTVDRTMDPKSRNKLISKQVRNSLRNNKKSNPLRLAALGLQARITSEHEQDVNAPFNESAPVENDDILQGNVIPEVKQEEDDTVEHHSELRNELNAGSLQIPDKLDLQSYEHVAALADAPEVNRSKVAQLPQVEKDENSSMEGGSPVIDLPGKAKGIPNTPVLTPPPENANSKDGSPILEPASSFYRLGASPLGFRAARENNSRALESPTNEFNSPRAPLAEQMITNTLQNDLQENGELDEGFTNDSRELDLRPSFSEGGLADYMGHYLDASSSDDYSASGSVKKRSNGGYNIWNERLDLTENNSRRPSVPSKVLNKLLESETRVENGDANQSINSEASQGYIRTPTDDVFVGKGLSVNGLEAIVSNEEASERNSILFDEFNDLNLYQTPMKSPIGRAHVKSPFKPVSPPKASAHGITKQQDEQVEEEVKPDPHTLKATQEALQSETNSESLPDLESDSRLEHKPLNNSAFTNEKETKIINDLSGSRKEHGLTAERPEASGVTETTSPKEVTIADNNNAFPDNGALYLKLGGISGIMLHGVKAHKAQFALEFDNGKNVAQSQWQPMTDNGCINFDREFEVLLDKNPKKQGKIIVTLKCRYEKIVYEPEMKEIIEKVPISTKKSLFGKKKEYYQYQKKLVMKSPKEDEWEYLFARDGSFGRCELVLDEDFLNHTRFQVRTIKLDIKNEWARQHGPPNKKPYQLPRVAPYIIGKLKLDVCYLSRSSALEKFPKSLAIAFGILSKYRSQQSMSKEGYLMQTGGDLGDEIIRRYFKLRGNKLVGYHEITREAKIIINLLMVSDVLGMTYTDNEDSNEEQQCFQLVFANGDTITFDTEFSTDEKYDWFVKLKRIVDLNKSHQPWVKAFHQSIIINNV